MGGGKRSAGAAKLAWACLFSLAAVPAMAQAPRGAQTVYTNRATFSLPVRMEDRDRAELKELKFYAKSPGGPRAGQWVCVETAPPTKNRFSFQAAYDGEYAFAFVTVDKAGQVAPPNLDKAAPGLVVVVDTHAPEIDVQKMPVASGETYLQCQLKDMNPDYTSLRLEYQTAEKGWRALEPQADTPGVFRVTDGAMLRGVVRASAADKAGNRMTREINLGRDTATTTAVTRAPATQSTQPPPVADGPIMPASAQRVTEKPSTEEPAQAPRQVVNSLHCRMEYSMDVPNVTRVEAYATRDNGKTWLKLGEDADRRSPFEFDVPEDGVYGISLVLTTGSRPAAAPAAGDTPDWWIEADTTRPVVTVGEVRRGAGDEANLLTVNWSAQDKNFGSEAVEMLWSSQPDGPWQTALRGMKAEGTARWTLPQDGGNRIYLRFEATDKAGNVGRCEPSEPIELTKPKAKVLGITAGGSK